MERRPGLQTVLVYVAAIVLAVVILAPFVWLAIMSISSAADLSSRPLHWLPQVYDFSRYVTLLSVGANSAGAATTRSQEVTRGLALAALAVLGGVGDAQESRFDPLLRDLRNADCLQMAKMNLNQCLAVAGPQYEDVFCMGRHAVGETAQCLSAAAGDGPAQGARTAELDGYGAERAEAYADPHQGN